MTAYRPDRNGVELEAASVGVSTYPKRIAHPLLNFVSNKIILWRIYLFQTGKVCEKGKMQAMVRTLPLWK